MLSYHNDPTIKTKYLRRVRAHREADLLAQGETGSPSKGERGCAVACTLDRYDHAGYEAELGLPEWLAILEDTIFERLPPNEAMEWPEQFLDAIPVGVDLDRVRYRFALALLGENADRVNSLEIDGKLKTQVLDAIEQVAAVNRVAEETGEWDESSAEAAWAAARSAARSAAWAAARSAVWATARSAAEAARSSAEAAEEAAWSAVWATARSYAEAARSSAEAAEEAAARSAEESAAEAAARAAAYIRYRDVLLDLLRDVEKQPIA